MNSFSDGTVVVWIHPRGKASLLRDGKLVPEARKILEGKAGILAPDVFWTGEEDLWDFVVKQANARKLPDFLGIREIPADPSLN